MILWPMKIHARKDQDVFRPLETTFPVLTTQIEKVIKSWIRNNPMNHGVEVVLEKKSPQENGVGAIWSSFESVVYETKDGTQMRKIKRLHEVKSIIPNRELVLEISLDPSSVPTVVCGADLHGCVCRAPPPPPTTVKFVTTGKGDTTQVTVDMSGTVPSCFQANNKLLFLIPCLWPHCILGGVAAVLCLPCCRVGEKWVRQKAFLASCDQGLASLKVLCETGPEAQVMTDSHPNHANNAANPFCAKCGTQFPNSSDPFCAKCGTSR